MSALTLDDELDLHALAAVPCTKADATRCAFCAARALLPVAPEPPRRAPGRPVIVSDAHLECLDEALDAFGERPMLGALLQLKFGLTRAEAFQVLGYWMASYAARHGRRTS
jgi:hypothetical protein